MRNLKTTTIQFPISWENKLENLKTLESLIRPLSGKTELVILPEMFNTGFSMNVQNLAEKMDGSTIQWMRDLSKSCQIILTGSIIIEENGNYFNRLIWMLPNGQVGQYDKRHLFAYADEDKYFKAGQQRFIGAVNGWRLNMQICYDLRFPVWSRQQQPAEYDVLVYVANWPARRALAWKSLLRARAIENQCYVIGINRVGVDGKGLEYQGDSMVIDPLGECLHHAKDQTDIFSFELDYEKLNHVRAQFPFWKDADSFTIFPSDEV